MLRLSSLKTIISEKLDIHISYKKQMSQGCPQEQAIPMISQWLHLAFFIATSISLDYLPQESSIKPGAAMSWNSKDTGTPFAVFSFIRVAR